MHDAEEILGVRPGATENELYKAFRRKAKVMHTDVGGSFETFTRLQLAYDTLLNKSTQPDNSIAAIAELYHSMVSQLGSEVMYLDIIAEMRKHFANQISNVENNIAKHEARIKLFEKLNTQCEPNSLIYGINSGSIAGLNLTIRNLRNSIVGLQACLDRLEQEHFTPEPRAYATFTTGSSWRTV